MQSVLKLVRVPSEFPNQLWKKRKKVRPQSAAILDRAERLVRLDLADYPGIYPFFSSDSLELDQRCPPNELKESWLTNSESLMAPY